MMNQALKSRSIRERLGLVMVDGVVMTPAEAASRGKAQRSNTAPVGAAKQGATASQPALSASSARAAERTRWERVMLSERAKGRERIAAAMLASGDESAATILAKLANVRSDVERQRASTIERQARAGTVWDRVIARTFGTGEAS